MLRNVEDLEGFAIAATDGVVDQVTDSRAYVARCTDGPSSGVGHVQTRWPSQLLGRCVEARHECLTNLKVCGRQYSRANFSVHKESNMILNRRSRHERQGSSPQTFAMALSVAYSLGFTGPLLAAPSQQLVAAADAASASPSAAAETKPDHACMGELRTFSEQMQKEGYWLRVSGLDYG
jgi:hypothetical protein